jgi:hypothetical protein
MDFRKKFVVKPGAKVKLGDIDPAYIGEHESYQSGSAEITRHAASLALLNINSTPKTRVRCLLSCKVSMRQAKTASYVTSSAARTHKGSM